jgi:hypothetical protein
MATLGSHVGITSFDQDLPPPVWGIGEEGSPFPWGHGHAEFHDLAGHLRSFRDALLWRIRVDHLLPAMQQFSGRGEVMHVGGSVVDGMDQA